MYLRCCKRLQALEWGRIQPPYRAQGFISLREMGDWAPTQSPALAEGSPREPPYQEIPDQCSLLNPSGHGGSPAPVVSCLAAAWRHPSPITPYLHAHVPVLPSPTPHCPAGARNILVLLANSACILMGKKN